MAKAGQNGVTCVRSPPLSEASGPLSIDLRAEYWRQDHTVKNGVKG